MYNFVWILHTRNKSVECCIFFSTCKPAYILCLCRDFPTVTDCHKTLNHLVIFCQFTELFFNHLDRFWHLVSIHALWTLFCANQHQCELPWWPPFFSAESLIGNVSQSAWSFATSPHSVSWTIVWCGKSSSFSSIKVMPLQKNGEPSPGFRWITSAYHITDCSFTFLSCLLKYTYVFVWLPTWYFLN